MTRASVSWSASLTTRHNKPEWQRSRRSSSRIAAKSRFASSAHCATWGSARSLFTRILDRVAQHPRYADEALALGGDTSAESYLVVEKLLAAAEKSGAGAVHPGYGFLAENAAFARAVEAAGLVWIGPPPAAIELMGSKTRARQAMQAAGVPIIPGTTDPVGSAAEVVALGEEIGYPLLIKAAAGGGGKGMKVVDSAEEAAQAFESAQREGLSYFADASVYVEKLPRGPAPRRGAGARGRARQRRPSRRA